MMSNCFRNSLLRLALVASCLLVTFCVAFPPAVSAARADVDSFLFWSTEGTANPELTYKFQAQNTALITSAAGFELIAPAVLVGRTTQNGSGPLVGCSDIGTVESLFFECWDPSQTEENEIPCPVAEGTWRSVAQLTLGSTQIFAGISGSVIANCPPVCTDVPDFPSFTAGQGSADARAASPVSSGFQASLVAGIDLDTGYQIDREVAGALPRSGLHRVKNIEGTRYVLDEFAVVRLPANHPLHVERASSPRTANAAAQWGQSLRELGAGKARGNRLLLIQGMEHLTGERRPMVKFRPSPGVSLGEGEQIVVRARFSEAGQVEEVETLQGNPAKARVLVGDMDLEFIDGSEHRVVVYAVFQGGKRPELTAAIPTFIQCCCDGFLCPG